MSATLEGKLEVLDRDDCLRRLEARGVGRIGVSLQGRPLIYPVSYTVHEEHIYVLTRHGGDLHAATPSTVAFEIDGIDALAHEGWSVLVSGRCAIVSDHAELAHLAHLRLTPWAGEDRDLLLRISMDVVSGRHIHHRAT
ncbi:MAG TPA: pyridoxamine 5'-phosphate oxidase family protein [Acidimicrobiales bacterium]|nr:pyridoxamine 5'-phosphate oxidase family protein [Acidimicrobiales bacterium]